MTLQAIFNILSDIFHFILC